MQEHHMFLWEIYTLAAFLGSPVFLLGAAGQSWLLLRRTALGKLRSLVVVLLSIAGAIILAVRLWLLLGNIDEQWFMLFNFINLPALLSTLIIVPPVTLMVFLAKRAKGRVGIA